MKNISLLTILFFFSFCNSGNAKAAAYSFPDEYSKYKFIDSIFIVWPYSNMNRDSVMTELDAYYNITKDPFFTKAASVLSLYDKHMVTHDTLFIKLLEKKSTELDAYPSLKSRINMYLGYHFMLSNTDFEKVFDYYYKTEELLDKHGIAHIPNFGHYYVTMAPIYFKFKDYRKIISLMNKVLAVQNPAMYNFPDYNFWAAKNNIGLCYRELGILDSSSHYFMAASQVENTKDTDLLQAIAMGNLGYNYYLQKEYAKALPLIQNDKKVALKYYDTGLAAGAAIPLAGIYLQQKQYTKAWQELQYARRYINISKQYDRLEKYFPVMSQYYFAKKDLQKSNDYKDSAITAILNNNNTFNNMLLMRVQQKNDLYKLQLEQHKFDQYKNISKTKEQIIIIIVVALFVIAAVFYYFQRKNTKTRQQLAEVTKILSLRKKISADMHDEIGSTLSSISLYAHLLQKNPDAEKQNQILGKIKDNTQHIQENMSDIIWSINPNMDNFESILIRMRAFGADIAETKNIAFLFEENVSNTALHLDMLQRKNLYLIYKEAVNNAVKYSGCSQLKVALNNAAQHRLTMTIQDNGSGFDLSQSGSGNGLSNMKKRAEEINAIYHITSEKNKGTTITLQV